LAGQRGKPRNARVDPSGAKGKGNAKQATLQGWVKSAPTDH
jgi:hypothetical protein